MKSILTTFLLTILLYPVYAQTGEISGEIRDANKELLYGSEVSLIQNNNVIRTVLSAEGFYSLTDINPGKYTVRVINGFDTSKIEINVTPGAVMTHNFAIVGTETIDTEVIVRPHITTTTSADNSEDPNDGSIPDMGILLPVSIDVNIIGNTFSFGGTRPSGTAFNQDGIRLLGPTPQMGLGMVGLNTVHSGVPVRYGDFTGGMAQFVSVTPSLHKRKSFEVYTTTGLNPYHNNRFHSYFTGPLIVKEYHDDPESAGKDRMILGYNLSTFFIYNKDPNPAYDGIARLSDDVLANIEANPLTPSEQVGSFVPTASFLTEDDLVRSRVRSNASQTDASAELKLYYTPTPRFSIDMVNRYRYIRDRLYSFNNSLLNEARNPLQTQNVYTGFLTLTHTLRSPYSYEGKQLFDTNDLVSRLIYTIQVDYQNQNIRTVDPFHQDRIFDYGHIGKFETMRTPIYTYRDNQPKTVIDQNGNEVNLREYHELTGYQDTSMSFTSGGVNPLLARYNEIVSDNSQLNSEQDLVERGGMLNGQNPANIYSLFLNAGTVTSGYSQVQNERFGITAFTEATLHPSSDFGVKHDVQMGIQYEQYFRSYYSLNARGLWTLMPLLVNNHINYLDKRNAVLSYDDQGRFTDTLFYGATANAADQFNFDKNLRDKLIAQGARDANGNLIGETSRIDVNALDPETFSLDMFSTDELLNDGNAFVAYSGFDHMGNRQRGRSSINDFINDPKNRPMNSYSPILAAAWIQDKFKIHDIVLRAGLRIERFDANQPVLNDPYSLFPVKTIGEVRTQHPGLEVVDNLTDDHIVYVDDINSPNRVTGYRKGDQWYDNNGNAISNPEVIATESSRGAVQPLLVDPTQTSISEASFKNYDAQINFLPRLSFFFPMTSTSMFFANYDKLAQRPLDAQTFTPLSTYLNFQSASSGIVPNAAMKPRLKTDYKVGFSQYIGSFSTVTLSAQYSEIRNDFNQIRIGQGYPYSYSTYSNIDFSTVKSFKMQYSYDDQKLALDLNYNLQFADGTGSNVNSAQTLIQSGQPNLRTLYPLSFDIRHTVKGSITYRTKDIVKKDLESATLMARATENMFFSMNFQMYSGVPYTSITTPISEAQSSLGLVQRSQVKGNPFGSRMPWRVFVSARIQKSIVLKSDVVSGFEVPKQTLDIFLVANNLLNSRIVERVYSFTGSSTDDGYLNSPVGQQQAANQLDAETFRTLYDIKLQNPSYIQSPRIVQLGFRFNFF